MMAFLIFIFGGMLILYIDAWHHKTEALKSTVTKNIALPPFSVIVACEGTTFHLAQSDSNLLILKFNKYDTIRDFNFATKNDTLFVKGKSGKRFVYCKNIKSIVTNKDSRVIVDKITSGSLDIHANGGKIYMQLPKDKPQRITALAIVSSNEANIDISVLNMNVLSINSVNSEVAIDGKISVIHGRLSNHSMFICKQNPDKIDIEKDSSSVMSFQQ